MVQDLDLFPQQFIRYGSGLRFFYIKIYLLWFRTQKFFSKFFFTMAQKSGLKFFFTKISSVWFRTQIFFCKNLFAMVQDLDFFSNFFFHYGSGLNFFFTKISSVWLRTQIFFRKNLFAMVQDLKFFFQIFFFHHGSGLRIFLMIFLGLEFFFFNKIPSLCLRTLHHGSGLKIFFQAISSRWLRTSNLLFNSSNSVLQLGA